MKVDVIEYIEDDGGRFTHRTEERTYPNSEGRHSDLCIACGFPTYPECRNFCKQQGYTLENDNNN